MTINPGTASLADGPMAAKASTASDRTDLSRSFSKRAKRRTARPPWNSLPSSASTALCRTVAFESPRAATRGFTVDSAGDPIPRSASAARARTSLSLSFINATNAGDAAFALGPMDSSAFAA